MKTITSQPIWTGGVLKQATVIYSQVNSDNLKDKATFYYQLYEAVDYNIYKLIDGTIDMSGNDYINYNTTTDANAYAWNWLASELGLTITGEYVKPKTPLELSQESL